MWLYQQTFRPCGDSRRRKQGDAANMKPHLTVLLCDDDFSDLTESIIKQFFGHKYAIKPIRFKRASELLKLAGEQSFDLIFLYVGNVEWDTFTFNFPQAAEFLSQLRKQFGKPIIATQGMDLRKLFEGTGVQFLLTPFTVEEFQDALKNNILEQTNDP
jgi:hypothetical protein